MTVRSVSEPARKVQARQGRSPLPNVACSDRSGDRGSTSSPSVVKSESPWITRKARAGGGSHRLRTKRKVSRGSVASLPSAQASKAGLRPSSPAREGWVSAFVAEPSWWVSLFPSRSSFPPASPAKVAVSINRRRRKTGFLGFSRSWSQKAKRWVSAFLVRTWSQKAKRWVSAFLVAPKRRVPWFLSEKVGAVVSLRKGGCRGFSPKRWVSSFLFVVGCE